MTCPSCVGKYPTVPYFGWKRALYRDLSLHRPPPSKEEKAGSPPWKCRRANPRLSYYDSGELRVFPHQLSYPNRNRQAESSSSVGCQHYLDACPRNRSPLLPRPRVRARMRPAAEQTDRCGYQSRVASSKYLPKDRILPRDSRQEIWTERQRAEEVVELLQVPHRS